MSAWRAQGRRGRGRGERVLDVVIALEGELGEPAEPLAPAGMRNHSASSAVRRAAREEPGMVPGRGLAGPAAREQPPGARGPADRGQRRDAGVVEVHERKIGGGLVLEDAQLGVDVAAEGAVPVDVVLGQVEEHGHVGAKALDVLSSKLDARPRRRRPAMAPGSVASARPRCGHLDRAPAAAGCGGQLGGRRPPLVPSIAIERLLRNRAASSISLQDRQAPLEGRHTRGDDAAHRGSSRAARRRPARRLTEQHGGAGHAQLGRRRP